MSLTLELRGQTSSRWPLSTNCLDHVDRIERISARGAIECLFGDEKTEDGTLRTVGRTALLEALDEIAIEAKSLPSGFEMLVPPFLGKDFSFGWGGGGFSGFTIDGKYHSVDCRGDHWTLQSIDDMREGKQPIPRYDAAEIPTENFGVIKVRPKKSRSDLSKLIRQIQKFIDNDPSGEIQIIWG